MKATITGLVLTFNGERLLKDCLHSLNFCDKILVVDSHSTDSTKAIAESFGSRLRFIKRAWEGPGPQFAFALGLIDTDWIISLDQDEICTNLLQQSVLNVLKENNEISSYWICRRSWYYNRFMGYSGWYPDKLLRMFKAGQVKLHISGAHYSFKPKGKTDSLKGDILHYPYENFKQHLEKINYYAQEAAEDMSARGKHGGIIIGLIHGTWRFVRIYMLKFGFLDGRAGFINAVHGAFYAFLKYVRIGEGKWGVPFDHNRHR